MRGLIEMAEYRQRTVSKQKKDKLRLPEYTTRTVVIWGLKEEEKSASFIKGFLDIETWKRLSTMLWISEIKSFKSV